jgi:hypothetical protein
LAHRCSGFEAEGEREWSCFYIPYCLWWYLFILFGNLLYPSVLIRGARCCDSCWCRSIWNFRWNRNSKHQLQSCIRDRQAGGLASECSDSLVFRCSDSCRCRPISYSVERWSPSNKYQLQPNIRDRYLHCQVYFGVISFSFSGGGRLVILIPFQRSTSNSGFS